MNKMSDTGLTQKEVRELERLKDVVSMDDVRQAQQTHQQYEVLHHELQILKYYRLARNSRGQVLRDCNSNKQAIENAHVDVDLFCEFCKDDKFAANFAWTEQPLPKKEALQQDKQEFEEFCVANRYNAGTAGFELARQVIGVGQLSQASLTQAVRSGKLRLGAATPEDLEEREEIRLDKEKLRLQNAQAHELKQEVRQGAAARRIEAQRQHRDYEFELRKQIESTTQYPPLPQMLPDYLAKRYGTIKLDRAFLIKKADRDAFKFLHLKYGLTQVEQLLRGEI
jgi:hypothetical protein